MTERFVNELRTRASAIRLVGSNASTEWTVRVQGAEVFDAVKLIVSPDTPVRDVKQAAMAELLPDVDAIDLYVVKLRGIEVHDENVSLIDAGATDGSILLVMSRRRRPVR